MAMYGDKSSEDLAKSLRERYGERSARERAVHNALHNHDEGTPGREFWLEVAEELGYQRSVLK